MTAAADVCTAVAREESFAPEHRQSSAYFDEYFVRKDGGTYRVLAVKRLQAEYERATDVMSALDDYDKFMPGYKRIRVDTGADGALYTAIRFQPDFSFFESRFTNEVSIARSPRVYHQCWRQLDEHDPAVLEKHRMAPSANRGYWRITTLADGGLELRYFSVIQPPIPIPGFIYKRVVKGDYQEVFESITARIGKPAN